jgi:prepilin-type N-terminal cleavage/methylation domain-containing protein
MACRGFSMIEVLISVALLSVAVLGGVQLVATSVQAISAARSQNLSVILASARLEDLRGLTYEFDDLGVASTDLQTDLSATPRTLAGAGLATGGSIAASVAGYADHLDGRGHWVGAGNAVPSTAAYTRRWSIAPSVVAPDCLVLEVLVFPVAARPTGASGRDVPGAAHMVTLLARRQR